VTDADREDPAFAAARDAIAADTAARDRYLAYVHDNADADVRARMIAVAHTLAWLDAAQLHREQARVIADLLAQPVLSAADIALACRLSANRALADEAPGLVEAAGAGRGGLRDAVLACLGEDAARARLLAGLARGDEDSARAAEVYFTARPVQSTADLEALVSAIAGIEASETQVRALDTLARQPLLDGAALQPLVAVFKRTRSVQVQRAVAGVLIRSDRPARAAPGLLATLRAARLRTHDGDDMVEALLRRLGGGYTVARTGGGPG
jgi:hypothetical protein